MKASAMLQKYGSFEEVEQETEESDEKDITELNFLPRELEREDNALDTIDQDTVGCEEKKRRIQDPNISMKKKRKRKRLEITIDRAVKVLKRTEYVPSRATENRGG
ncbi:hypothetical protein KIL84_002292 [Mauremys mutica]|uniref:Uncharacterized protein n=1 Tax=Mauremys mutica TaxID=74926 RepID=A0A9D4AXF7_9SAUR|nr:hypothetical protein KIL84_002292 [Mauremys mutica]